MVYVIYSIIKAGKKVVKNRPVIDPQQSQPTVQPPTGSPLPQQDFKKMLEDLLGGTREEKIPEPQIPKAQVPIQKLQPVKIALHNTPKKETITASQVKPFSAKLHKPSEKITRSQHIETTKKVFSEPVVVEESVMDFDIREAVIYSEILKRPEY